MWAGKRILKGLVGFGPMDKWQYMNVGQFRKENEERVEEDENLRKMRASSMQLTPHMLKEKKKKEKKTLHVFNALSTNSS